MKDVYKRQILAGDGLLTYAFQLMTENQTATPQQKIDAIKCIATAAGPEGMVGGQAFDMLSENKHIPLEELKVDVYKRQDMYDATR